MNIENIKLRINEYIKDKPFTLYDVRETTIFDSHALEILIENEDAPISTEDITYVHRYLMSLPDEVIPDSLMIEVSSVGLERPLVSDEDYTKAIGKYIFITSDFYKGYATLNAFDNHEITITFSQKTKQKKMTIPLQAISHARRAVKI